jgi:hypothetical protein
MMVRKFTPKIDAWWDSEGGKLIWTEYEVEDVGMADTRLEFDADVIDVSSGLFSISNALLCEPKVPDELTVFSSRRFRSHRTKDQCTFPTPDDPLLFIGNPVRLWRMPGGGCVINREPSYIIKSGCELGY